MSTAIGDRHEDTIDRLEALLFLIAGGVLPNRAEAIVYSNCRSDLLQSPIHDLLPGFLYQCLTVFKFKDFITLYDPDPALRESFIRKMFERCRSMSGAAGRDQPVSAPAQAAFDPHRWML